MNKKSNNKIEKKKKLPTTVEEGEMKNMVQWHV